MPLTANDEPRELARSWNAVLGRLEIDVNEYNFNTWLAALALCGSSPTLSW